MFGSDLVIEAIEWSQNQHPLQYKVKLTVSWNNSWRNEKNYDAAWLFLKYVSPSYQQTGYRHAKLDKRASFIGESYCRQSESNYGTSG